jgi:hypothetical protein
MDEMDVLYDKFIEKVITEIDMSPQFVTDTVSEQMDKVKNFLDKSIERTRRIEAAERRAKRRAVTIASVTEEDVSQSDAPDDVAA